MTEITLSIVDADADTMMIMRGGNILAGSIKRINGLWHVEVLWGGPGGDIRSGGLPLRTEALAFVRGVEAALIRMIHGQAA